MNTKVINDNSIEIEELDGDIVTKHLYSLSDNPTLEELRDITLTCINTNIKEMDSDTGPIRSAWKCYISFPMYEKLMGLEPFIPAWAYPIKHEINELGCINNLRFFLRE